MSASGPCPQSGAPPYPNGTLAATVEHSTCADAAIDLALLACNGIHMPAESKRLLLGTRLWTRDNLASGGTPVLRPGDIQLATLQRQHAGILTTTPATDQIFRLALAQSSAPDARQQLQAEDLHAAAVRYPQIEFFERSPDAGRSQADVIDELAGEGLQAILVAADAQSSSDAAGKAALARGIRVIALDELPTAGSYSVFVGADLVAMGATAGRHIQELLGDGGTIVELQGGVTTQPAKALHDGFAQALELQTPK